MLDNIHKGWVGIMQIHADAFKWLGTHLNLLLALCFCEGDEATKYNGAERTNVQINHNRP